LTGVGLHGEMLVIHNVSRYCDGVYECMAFNDVPPAVQREMKVEVECQYTYISIAIQNCCEFII